MSRKISNNQHPYKQVQPVAGIGDAIFGGGDGIMSAIRNRGKNGFRKFINKIKDARNLKYFFCSFMFLDSTENGYSAVAIMPLFRKTGKRPATAIGRGERNRYQILEKRKVKAVYAQQYQ